MNSLNCSNEFLLINNLLEKYDFCQVYINEELFAVIHSNEYKKNKDLAYISLIELLPIIIDEIYKPSIVELMVNIFDQYLSYFTKSKEKSSIINKSNQNLSYFNRSKERNSFINESNKLSDLYSSIDNHHDLFLNLLIELLKLRSQKKIHIYTLPSGNQDTYIAGIIGIFNMLKQRVANKQYNLESLLNKLICLLKGLYSLNNFEIQHQHGNSKNDVIFSYVIFSNIERWTNADEESLIPTNELIEMANKIADDVSNFERKHFILDFLFPTIGIERKKHSLALTYREYLQAYRDETFIDELNKKLQALKSHC